MRKFKYLALLIASAALTACGGGGGGSEGGATSSANTAEGFWSGSASTGYNVSLAILENGDAWGVYASGNTIYGALKGSATGTGTSFRATGTDFNFSTNTASAGSYSGTVVSKTSINATSANSTVVSLRYSADYDQAASLSNIAGTYNISGRAFAAYFIPQTLTVDSTGRFSLIDRGCTASGTLAPRSSGKNVYNLSVSLTGTCVFSGIATGIAILDASTLPKKFVALALKSDNSDGIIVVGTKQ